MLVKLLTEFGSRPTVVVWDAGTSGRKDVYAEYKGHRPDRPDLLNEQWPNFEPLVAAFGYSNTSVKGYEADDVIGTLAKQAGAEGTKVTVVTGDRDSFQLVDEQVKIMATARGITETKIYDREAVIDRYGIPPELVPDFIGLKGDTSDNIPGVPGIGDKTAAQLLQQFGSLEKVLESVDEISGTKRKENLINYAEDARISKQLGTIICDLDVPIDLGSIGSGESDLETIREMFRRFEIREPLKRIEAYLGAPEVPIEADAPTSERTTTFEEILTEELEEAIGEGEITLALLPPVIPDGALFSEEEHWRFGIRTAQGRLLAGACPMPAALLDICRHVPIVTHDAKLIGAVPSQLAFDTFVAAFLIDPARRQFPLEELANDRGISSNATDLAVQAVEEIYLLAEEQRKELKELDLQELFETVEMPSVFVLRAMELAGIKLDPVKLDEILGRVGADITTLESEIHELAGEEFTIGSPQQLSEILFVKLGLSRKRRGKTGYSTDARVLQAIRDEHPIIEKIERYRELTKLVSTYLEPLPKAIDPADGRIHTTFNQAGAATGRLSSTNPNLQNIPIRTEVGREVRGCFVAEKGNVLVSADYSQVELRVLADIANEGVLKEIFKRGEDVHTATAAEVFQVDADKLEPGMRSKAKMVNYGIVYGLSAFGLADRLQIPQLEAKEFIDRYFAGFPAVQTFIDETVKLAADNGYVATKFGRRRRIPELRARNFQTRQLGERLAVNTVIQGTAADIIKIAMVRSHDALRDAGMESKLILQIHDELLFEGPEDEVEAVKDLARKEMIAAADIDPPLVVDVGAGPTWLEAK